MKQIPGCSNYLITKDGQIYSKPRPGTKGGWKTLAVYNN